MKINPDYLNFLSAYIEKFDSLRESQKETLKKCVFERNLLERRMDYYLRKYSKNGASRKRLDDMIAALQKESAGNFYEQSRLEKIDELREKYKFIAKRSSLESRYYFLSMYLQENKLKKEFGEIKRLKEQYNLSRDIIVKSDLKLVLNRAMKKSNKLNGTTSLEFGDLFDAGLEGLINSISTYDLSRKCMFSTHACTYIDGWMQKLVYGDDLIISHGIRNAVRKLQKILNSYIDKNNHYPTIDELAKKLRVSLETALGLWNMHDNPIVSLDHSVENNDGRSRPLSEMIPAKEVKIEDFTLKPGLNKIFEEKKLSERMREVLTLRLGIGDFNKKYTLAEIAALISAKEGNRTITRERIRQIECSAIKKIIEPVAKLLNVKYDKSKNMSKMSFAAH